MFIFVIDKTYTMSYLSVITLDEAKTYLRIDDTLTEDDTRITSMIKAALSIIEKRTNVLVYARDKKYLFQDYCLRVYDYPINTTDDIENVSLEEKELYSLYTTSSSDVKNITINVGYENTEDVPSNIIECALEYIKYMYYDAETNTNKLNKIPMYIDDMINQNKRFII